MRAVVQRVRDCSVKVKGEILGLIERGLLVYLGVERGDDESDISYLAEKIINLRIIGDAEGKMNLSVLDMNQSLLVISQFTLCADTRKGRRPSYIHAADPVEAEELYRRFIVEVGRFGLKVEAGKFRAMMDVKYINEGPVTILLDSKKHF